MTGGQCRQCAATPRGAYHKELDDAVQQRRSFDARQPIVQKHGGRERLLLGHVYQPTRVINGIHGDLNTPR